MTSNLQYEELKGDTAEYLQLHLTNVFRSGYVSCNGCILPEYFRSFGEQIQQLDVRDDDIWVCSFPKSGTTWTQETVWCIANNLNFEAAKELLPARFPFLERSVWTDHRKVLSQHPDLNLKDYELDSKYELDSVAFVDKMAQPRFIQTHLPFSLLPEKLRNNNTSAKIIYVMRHPGDTCVSYYHFFRLFDGYRGSLEEFCELFLQGMVLCGPHWQHIQGYRKQTSNCNVLIIKYEDMKKDLRCVIHRISNFLSKPLTEGQVDELLYHLSFENMKKNRAVNYEHDVKYFERFNLVDEEESFIRKGKVGEWRQAVGPTLAARFDKWMEEHFGDLKLTF